MALKEKDFIENAGNYSDTLGLAYIIGYNEKDNDQYEDVRKIFTANAYKTTVSVLYTVTRYSRF